MPSVLFESDDILVLNKPAGLIVHSDGRTEEPSVADWILEHYPALRDVGGSWVCPKPAQGRMPGAKRLGISPQGERILLPGIAHRLDRMTSGVLLVAKTEKMYTHLKNEFKERRVEKIYHAYVYGHMDAKEGRIVAEIMRSSEAPRHWYARPTDDKDKRAAITEWKLLKNTDGPAAYLEVRPKTGRTHQIRVHLASIGHPVVGDPLYSGDKLFHKVPARMYLHAYSISVNLSGVFQTFTAPIPADFLIRGT